MRSFHEDLRRALHLCLASGCLGPNGAPRLITLACGLKTLVGTSHLVTLILLSEQIKILRLLLEVFFKMVTDTERDEKIQSHGDRIQSIDQDNNGLKTTIEDQREENNGYFIRLEGMVGTILEESIGNHGKGVVDPPTSSYAAAEHTFKLSFKKLSSLTTSLTIPGTTYAIRLGSNVGFGGQGQDVSQPRRRARCFSTKGTLIF